MSTQVTPTYRDATKAVPERVSHLLAIMTVEEKLAQLGSFWVFELFEDQHLSETLMHAKLSQGIGQITRIGGASNVPPQESARLANQIQSYLVNQTRLGIPAIVHEECCSGYMANQATLFPQAIGIASTWNPDLTQAMGDTIRQQMRSVGAHQALAPVLDVTRDPRWGRVEETFGEDPYLVSRMGVAYIHGIQGEDLTTGVAATGKHFVGYGMSEGGKNWAPVFIPERELREVFVLPFAAAIKEGQLRSIMNAYHELDGIPCGSSKALMRDLLRGELGFDGIVVSDYFTVDTLQSYHGVAADQAMAARLALEAGIDVELPSTSCYGAPLRSALDAGTIDMALVEAALARILSIKFELGIFDQPYVDEGRVPEILDTPDAQALAYQLAKESIVLLKNEGNCLPLKKTVTSIAVIGPNAHSTRNLMGDYSYPAHIETLIAGNDMGGLASLDAKGIQLVDNPVAMNTVLESIQAAVSPNTAITYAQGCTIRDQSTAGFAEAVAAATNAEVAIVVVGDKAGLTEDCTTGESRDRADLSLPGVQTNLVQAIIATGTPVILVLVNGRPLVLTELVNDVPAILETWLPGEKGADAITDILFGDYNPGGKLPMSFPRSVGQIPVFYNHKPSGGRSHWQEHYVDTEVTPLYPFGYGLSYTEFRFSNLEIDTDTALANQSINIQVDIENVGERAGDEVAQLYVRYQGTSVTRPVKELKGFQRVTLQPNECVTVSFTLHMHQLAFYDIDMQQVIEPGIVEVMVGNSSQSIHTNGQFKIAGEKVAIAKESPFFTGVKMAQR